MAKNVAVVPPDQTSQPIANLPASGLFDSQYIVYPRDMADNQDKIRFTLREVKKSSITASPEDITKEASTKKVENVFPNQVFLPIQSGISDQNSANWGAGELNEFQKRLVNSSLKGMNAENLGQIPSIFKDLFKGIVNDPGFKTAGQLYFAEQAVGVQGLLSRVTGNVINPNLELLFQGPTLRPFQFQFKLSPRSEEEAKSVKQIIKFFKKNMAVRKGDSNLFLKAPYVFGIEYLTVSDDGLTVGRHPSIGFIKEACALQSCTVDYTPLGSYMTYNDDERTMVSYNINLQFQEIIPVYDSDYKSAEDIYGKNIVGY